MFKQSLFALAALIFLGLWLRSVQELATIRLAYYEMQKWYTQQLGWKLTGSNGVEIVDFPDRSSRKPAK